jgi:hypothetical protein
MSMMILHRTIKASAILFLIITTITRVAAQDFRVESQSAPSVVGAGTFVSLDAKFTIALPKGMHGFRPLVFNTAAGRAAGDAYEWRMKEGTFIAGYVEAPHPLDGPEMSREVFESIRTGMDSWSQSKNGKLVAHRQFDLDGHPALELKLEFPDRLAWQRYCLVSRRLFEVSLSMKTEQYATEALALKVLDSFKVPADNEIVEARKGQAAEAEPSPLPQTLVAARLGTDASDDGLHGKVKTVLEESEDLSGRWSVQGRMRDGMDYYDERGNLTRRESYDYKGNLSEIMIFGYLDGMRVSSRKSIRHEYNPPPMMMPSVPGAAKPKPDPRYSNKFTFQYDDQKRLIEKSWFMSNGELSIRYVFKYSGNQQETFSYAADNSPNRHNVSILDQRGNQIEQTIFDPRSGSISEKYSYTYEFDTHGNWIKRTTSKWMTKDDKSSYVPAYVHFRTITYY